MSGKGAKGLIMGKSAANNKDKDKKKPVSRSSRAGLQVNSTMRWIIDKRERKRKFVLGNVMEGGEEESSAEQHDARKAEEERKKKEKKEKNKKNKNKERKIDVDERRGEDGDAYNCSVGKVRNDGKLKEKKKRKVDERGEGKGSVDFDRIELEKDQMEKRKKKNKEDKHQDRKNNFVLGGLGSEQCGVKVEPKQEEERKGDTRKRSKNKIKKRKKSDQMQIEETIDEAQKNRGENVHVLVDDTCIMEEKSDNKGGKNKEEKLGRRNLDCPEDNRGFGERLDILNSEVTNRKHNSQNGKRKREISGCSNMNSGEECDRQSKCKDRKLLASGLDAHVTYNVEEEGGDTLKKHEKKRKKATVMKNCSKGNSQEKKDEDATVETAEETPGKVSSKKVTFADTIEVFPLENGPQEVVSGKRYSKEEDELLIQAIYNYMEFHGLGETGVEKLLNCTKHKLIGCWKEIAKSLPWRTHNSVYLRGIMLLIKSGEKIGWTPEDVESILQYHKKHGSKWSTLAKALGRYRYDVKDKFRLVGGGPVRKGKWTPEELDVLYNLVNKDLRSRSIYARKTHQGIFRDNIAWTSISEKMGTRNFIGCCSKWYSITSPMVSQKIWADTDDYRLVDALAKLDACSFVEVDWDNILEHRSGELCVRRWKELIRTVDRHYTKSFMEIVEILSQRYSWDILEAREAKDNNTEEAS